MTFAPIGGSYQSALWLRQAAMGVTNAPLLAYTVAMKYQSLLLLLACGSVLAGGQEGTYTATYRMTFDATWSEQTHPENFPANAHFSPLIGAVHGDDVELWRLGGEASPGIESMAETGATATLRGEMAELRQQGMVVREIRGPGINSPETTEMTLTVDRDHPFVTLVTMIAPSPDWFVGVSGLPLKSLAHWVPEVTVFLSAYDAGTDSGLTYTAFDANTIPQDIISPIDHGPLSDAGPLGTFRFELLGTSGAFPIDARMSGLYYAAERAGEGLSLNIANTVNGPTIAVTWYTYRNGQQLWLVGSATLSEAQDQVTIEMFETTGGQFGDAFVSDDVELETWGVVTLRFPDCGVVEVGYDGLDGAGDIVMEPLVADSFCSLFPR